MNGNEPTSALLSLQAKLDPAAEAMMRHFIGGAIRTQAVYVVAKLGIADQLTLGPRSAADLAERVRADAATLHRLMRFLVAQGVFLEVETGHFSLNSLAQLLQSAHPRSLRPSAIRAGEGLREAAGRLLAAVQGGATHDRATFFDRTIAAGKVPEFTARMSSSTAGLGESIAEHGCFAQARKIVDVGAGSGSVLIPILKRHAHLHGVLLDSASTAVANAVVAHAGLQHRCQCHAADFFKSVPQADIYLLSWVLHDWDDAAARRILRNCRVANPESTLLVCEALMPERAEVSNGPIAGLLADAFTLDMQMLLLTGGRERTLTEYRTLLELEGYEVCSTRSLTSLRGVSLIEARARPQ